MHTENARSSIRNWPEGERPREKLLRHGPGQLSDAELLGLLLGSGVQGCSAIELARSLIADFGSLRELLSADRSRWTRKGIGPARYAAVQAAVELTRRHFREALKVGVGCTLDDSKNTQRFLLAQLRDRPYEVFCCLYLDTRHRLIAFEELFRGTVAGANVHPREVLRQVLLHNASAVIFAHNHPGGSMEPSPGDVDVTNRLNVALALLGVRILDHFIVGESDCYSLFEHGRLKALTPEQANERLDLAKMYAQICA